MFSHVSRYLRFSIAALVAAAASATYAQEPPPGSLGTSGLTLEQIEGLVNDALPPILGGDNTQLVAQLLDVKPASPLSETFKLGTAVGAVFAGAQPTFAPDCSRTGTAVNEPDQGECNGFIGTPSGGGRFSQLSFSKNLGVGNIRFLSRHPATFVPAAITLPDADARKNAIEFLVTNFGLPRGELPLPPADPAGRTMFVSGLSIAGSSAAGEVIAPKMIQKLVSIPRALPVDIGVASPNGQKVPFIPAPGVAKVLFDQTGIIGVMVENWQELRPDPSLSGRNAKSKQQLTQEIAQDLLGDGGGHIAHLSAHIVYSSDWRGTFGYLVPAVQVYVAPAIGDLTADHFGQIENGNIGTAGIVRQYSLVAREGTVPGR